MSSLHNDIGFPERETSMPMSISSIIAGRREKMKTPADIRLEYYKKTELYQNVQGVNPVKLRELIHDFPEIKTEDDVDVAADMLVSIFDAPGSRRFYCDRSRRIKDADFFIQAVLNAFQPQVVSPPAYFGWLCAKKLRKSSSQQ